MLARGDASRAAGRREPRAGGGVITRKVCMLGSFAVGKTSLVRRFVAALFSDDYLTTVGVKIDTRAVRVDATEVNLVIWDVQGESDITDVAESYLLGASGYLVVVDGTRPETVDSALGLRARAGSLPGVILLNKTDLADEWRLGPADEAKLAGTGWPVTRTSAKSGSGVEEAFAGLARDLVG
jgi:small GTP-binding protein